MFILNICFPITIPNFNPGRYQQRKIKNNSLFGGEGVAFPYIFFSEDANLNKRKQQNTVLKCWKKICLKKEPKKIV